VGQKLNPNFTLHMLSVVWKPAPGVPEIIVVRMCGQAVLRGADVFATGVASNRA
jgi:hypothetical protein